MRTISVAHVTHAHRPSQVQGIALSSDPSYKVLGAAYPWVARRLLTDSNPELRETLRVLLYKGNRFQFSRLESLLRQALKSPARVSRARTASGTAGPSHAPTPDPAPQRGAASATAVHLRAWALRSHLRGDCHTRNALTMCICS